MDDTRETIIQLKKLPVKPREKRGRAALYNYHSHIVQSASFLCDFFTLLGFFHINPCLPHCFDCL